MLNDEAQSSNAPAGVSADAASSQAELIFDSPSLLERIRHLGVTMDASVMCADSTPNNPRVEKSFLRVPEAVWGVVKNRQQRYRNFGGVGVQLQLKNARSLSASSPITGFHAELVEDFQPHIATVNLIPVDKPGCNTAHVIDEVVLGELAPRITLPGQEANYPALLKAITRIAFEYPRLGLETLRGESFVDEKTFATKALHLMMRCYVAADFRAFPVELSPSPNPELVLKFAQQIGARGELHLGDVAALFIAFEKHFPGQVGGTQRIVRDLPHTFDEHALHTQGRGLGCCGYFEGPIISVDASGASVRQRVQNSSGDAYEREHTALSAHMLQRIEVIRKGWRDEPVAVDVIDGVTQVAPLECAQRLSLQAAYESDIIPRAAQVIRVNGALQAQTPKWESYEGQFLGTSTHHIYLRNPEGNYEAHLKCLFNPHALAQHTCARSSSGAHFDLRINYQGPMHGASLVRGHNRAIGSLDAMIDKVNRWLQIPSQRAGDTMLGPMSRLQVPLLHHAAVDLLGHSPREILYPTRAMSRAELASANPRDVRVAILADEHDGVVWGHRPGDRVQDTSCPSVGESDFGSAAGDWGDLLSLGASSDSRQSTSAGSALGTPRPSTRTNSPLPSRLPSSSPLRSPALRPHTIGSPRVPTVDLGR